MIRLAITGFGRIGRGMLRALFETPERWKQVEIVAVNRMSALQTSAHLLRYDSAHGRFDAEVVVDEDAGALTVNGKRIQFVSCADPEDLPWGELGIDVVCECTGKFKSRETAQWHIDAGAKKVLISAPSDGPVDAMVVVGVNDEILRPEHRIVCAASCTTNCLAPVIRALHDAVGVEKGLLTTVHAYTGDQSLVDGSHRDLRRARAAAHSIIPTKTGAAKAVGEVLPELKGKLHGYAVRVPTLNVSMVDFNFVASRATTVDEVNAALRAAEKARAGIIACVDEPLVSVDFNHHAASAIVDLGLTQVMDGNLVKVVAWYDNEWGFSNRMLDLAVAMMEVR